MTAQEIFDTVAHHLIAQGKPALSGEGGCSYRAPDGSKCAIGCLITDEEYSEEFEDKDIKEVLCIAGGLRERLGDHETLLFWLQDAHDTRLLYYVDGATNFPAWEERMRAIAKRFGLSDESLNRVTLSR